nr:EpsG family protein [Chryseobacterium foetidum]
MVAYILLLLSTSVFTFFRNRKNVAFVGAIIFLILVIFAGTRNVGIDNDYNLYSHLFRSAASLKKIGEEPTIALISFFAKALTNDYVRFTFIIYAFLGVYFKFTVIKNYHFFTLAVMLYVSNLFLGQEMTTIRAGVASGILLWMTPDLVAKNNKVVLLKILLATMFHNSSILFLSIYLVNRYDVKFKWMFLLLGLSLLTPILDLNFISIFSLDSFFWKAKVYLEGKKYEDTQLNIFNFKIIISLFYLVILYWFREKINYRGFDIFLKIHILSLVFFFLFSTTGLTFSLRTYELISVIQIILFPLIILCFSDRVKVFGYLIVLSTISVSFYYSIFVAKTLKEYSSWLF